MNVWFIVSFIAFIIAAVIVAVNGDGKWVEVFVLGGVAFFALGHGHSREVRHP